MKPNRLPDRSDLEGLLNHCRRNGRPAHFNKPEPRFFTDAERFRWWFRYGRGELEPPRGAGIRDLQSIRDWIDTEMAKHPEQVHT